VHHAHGKQVKSRSDTIICQPVNVICSQLVKLWSNRLLEEEIIK